jgi:hypothetical protein
MCVIVGQPIDMGDMPDNKNAQIRRRLVEQRRAEGLIIGAVLTAIEERVVIVPFRIVPDKGKAGRERVAQRAADRAADLRGIEIAVTRIEIALERIRRLGRDEVDRAARGIPAIERPLRPLEHLDTIQIEHREACEVGALR